DHQPLTTLFLICVHLWLIEVGSTPPPRRLERHPSSRRRGGPPPRRLWRHPSSSRRGDSKTFPSSGGGVAAKQTGWLLCVHLWLIEVCSRQPAVGSARTSHRPPATICALPDRCLSVFICG